MYAGACIEIVLLPHGNTAEVTHDHSCTLCITAENSILLSRIILYSVPCFTTVKIGLFHAKNVRGYIHGT